jgi:hypothetical protein
MGKKISGATRVELVKAIGERYGAGSRAEKVSILDEFVAVTGYHRKHAIRMLSGQELKRKTRRARKRLYDEAVREAVVVLWEASDRICGKRLKPLLPILLGALEGHDHMQLDEAVRSRLLAASAATIDRMLSPTRAAVGRRRPPVGAKPGIRRSVPVRTFEDWKDPAPGYLEADLVVHCGGSVAGSFVHTLTLTDIASGWTECVALVVREGALVVEALEQLQTTMPFPLRGLDTDNGGEFLNDTVLKYCTEKRIEFTRSRPYRKNDQAWVEQKNGSVVRRLVGYGRLEGIASAAVLSRLYAASRLFVNFFQPSFKLAEKTRVGARVIKRYHPPATPCARLMASAKIPDEMKDRLRVVLATLDPLRLLDEIRAAQHHLVGLITGETPHVALRRDADLDGFLKSLATAWRDGEVRPTHRTEPKPRRDWRTRADPFEAVDAQLRTWFEAEPERTGKELFQRLQSEHPDVFPDGQLRTFQRRLKQWRRAAARQLVFAAHPPMPVASDAG